MAGPVDADRLEQVDLPVVRRGLDPAAVRSILAEAADALRSQQRRIEELEALTRSLEDRLPDPDHLDRERETARSEGRAEGEAEGERTREAAREQADALVAEAKEEGRRLVGEAQTVRRRMLEDLARRRRILRQQIEQLRGGRERLLEAYEVVGHTMREATEELSVALPEARAAAERAGHGIGPEESVEQLEAEIESARMAGLPIVAEPGDEPSSGTSPQASARRRPVAVPVERDVRDMPEVEPVVADFEDVRILPASGAGPVVDDPAETSVAPDPAETSVVDDPAETSVAPDPAETSVVDDPAVASVAPDPAAEAHEAGKAVTVAETRSEHAGDEGDALPDGTDPPPAGDDAAADAAADDGSESDAAPGSNGEPGADGAVGSGDAAGSDGAREADDPEAASAAAVGGADSATEGAGADVVWEDERGDADPAPGADGDVLDVFDRLRRQRGSGDAGHRSPDVDDAEARLARPPGEGAVPGGDDAPSRDGGGGPGADPTHDPREAAGAGEAATPAPAIDDAPPVAPKGDGSTPPVADPPAADPELPAADPPVADPPAADPELPAGGDLDHPDDAAEPFGVALGAEPGSDTGSPTAAAGVSEVATPAVAELGRHLKRALADEQNDVLDRLRRSRKRRLTVDDLLDDPEVRVTRFAEVAEPTLQQASSRRPPDGGDREGNRPPNEQAAALAREVAESLADALLEPLEEGVTSEEMVARVRSLYREWKIRRVDVVAERHVAAMLDPGAG